MRRRAILLTGLGVLAYLVALVVQVPAGWALHWSRGSLPAGIEWQGGEGSIWHPRVRAVTVNLPAGNRLAVAPAELRVQPLRMLTGRLAVKARAGLLGGETRARGSVGLDGNWRVARAQGSLELAALSSVGPLLDFAQEGRLLFAARDLKGARLPAGGTFRASLEGFRVGWVDSPGPLGEYRLEGRVTGPGRIKGRVRTTEAGSLGLKGRLQADLRAGRARFDGEAWATDDAPDTVRDLLSMLGRVEGNRTRIQWRGRFRGVR